MLHVISSDQNLISTITIICQELNIKVQVSPTLQSLTKIVPEVSRLVIDLNALGESDPKLISARINTLNAKPIIISNLSNRENILLWSLSSDIEHLLVLDDKLLPVRLRETLNAKFVDDDLIKTYLPLANVKTIPIKNRDDVQKGVLELKSYAEGLNCFPTFPNMLQTIAHELALNSIVYSEDNEDNLSSPVQIQVGADDQYVWIAVSDPFGNLTRERLAASFHRCAKTELCEVLTEGHSAGVGLFMVYNKSSEITFWMDAGRATTVVCRIVRTKRYRELESQRASVHILSPS